MAPPVPTAAVAAAMPTSIPVPPVTAAAALPAVATPPGPVSTPRFEASALLGEWRFRAETGERDIEGILRFRVEENSLVGLYISPNGAATRLTNLEVSGNRIAWDLVTPRTTWHLRGTFSENWMNGTFQTATRTVQWTATRQSAAGAATPTVTPAR